jgi:protein-disulfide isomerase
MKKTSTKTIIVAVIATTLIGFAALVAHNYKNNTSFKYPFQSAEELAPAQNEQDPVNSAINAEAANLANLRKNSDLVKPLAKDFVLGDANAPVVMIEYASLSCPHCASFSREAFEKIKDEYIASGKVKFIFRNFPLNQSALVAAALAKCQANADANPAEKYYATLKVLFKTQDSWAFDEKFSEKLAAIAKLDSMSDEAFKKCIGNQKLQEEILKDRMDAAQTLQLRSTPTFFINGEIAEGYIDYVTLKKVIDKKLEEAGVK